MGLFDTVTVRDARFVCSEGHDLSGEEFQTKDLGCTMGSAAIDTVSAPDTKHLTLYGGGWNRPPRLPFLGRIHVYCSCSSCPAFVQAGTGNLCPTNVTFEVEVIDDMVRAITRVSESTADFLVNEPQKPYMVGCEGPMSHEEARRRHIEYPMAARVDRPRTQPVGAWGACPVEHRAVAAMAALQGADRTACGVCKIPIGVPCDPLAQAYDHPDAEITAEVAIEIRAAELIQGLVAPDRVNAREHIGFMDGAPDYVPPLSDTSWWAGWLADRIANDNDGDDPFAISTVEDVTRD